MSPGAREYSKFWHRMRQHRWEGGMKSQNISGASSGMALYTLMWYSRMLEGNFWFVFQPDDCCCLTEEWHRIIGKFRLDGISGPLNLLLKVGWAMRSRPGYSDMYWACICQQIVLLFHFSQTQSWLKCFQRAFLPLYSMWQWKDLQMS